MSLWLLVSEIGGHQIRFGDKMSERLPQDLKNRPSFKTMATVFVCPKISRINPCNTIFLSKYCKLTQLVSAHICTRLAVKRWARLDAA